MFHSSEVERLEVGLPESPMFDKDYNQLMAADRRASIGLHELTAARCAL
jgi:hypothetical protein